MSLDFLKFTNLGPLRIIPEDVEIKSWEDPVTIRAHDKNFYQFFVDMAGRKYYRIMFIKSPDKLFSKIHEFGIAYNQPNRRCFRIDYEKENEEYILTLRQTDLQGVETVRCSKREFPTGFTNPTTILSKGDMGQWDSHQVSIGGFFRFGDSRIAPYCGRNNNNKPYNVKVGVAWGHSLRKPFTKSMQPPYTPNSPWLSTFFDGRGCFQFGKVLLQAVEGRSNNTWSVGFFLHSLNGTQLKVKEVSTPVLSGASLGLLESSFVSNPYWLNDETQHENKQFYLYMNWFRDRVMDRVMLVRMER